VRYFVMGDNNLARCRTMAAASHAGWILHARPTGRCNRGTISRERPAHHQVYFVHLRSRQPGLECLRFLRHDYRKLAERSDVLLFDSAPMERDLEVTGPIAVKMFVYGYGF